MENNDVAGYDGSWEGFIKLNAGIVTVLPLMEPWDGSTHGPILPW